MRYERLIVERNPVIYLPGEEATGTTARDRAGYLAGTHVGGVTVARPALFAESSAAVEYNGSTGRTVLGRERLARANGAAGLTLLVWARHDTLPSGSNERLIAALMLYSTSSGLALGQRGSKLWGLSRSRTSDASAHEVLSTPDEVAGVTRLLAVRANFASNALSLLVNGQVVGATTPTYAATTYLHGGSAAYDDCLGTYGATLDRWYDGRLSHFAVIPAALSDAQIRELYRVGIRAWTADGNVGLGPTADPVARKIMIVTASGELLGETTSDGVTGDYSVALPAGGAVYGLAVTDYGAAWAAGAAHALGARCVATTNNGHWYECETAGTTGGTEPTWPTDGSTVSDGTAVWRDKGVVALPWIEGPYVIPAATA